MLKGQGLLAPFYKTTEALEQPNIHIYELDYKMKNKFHLHMYLYFGTKVKEMRNLI